MYQLNPRRFLPDSSLYSPSTLSKVAARDVNSLGNSGRCLSQSLSSHVGGAEVSRMCSDERMHDGARSLPIRCVAHDVLWSGVPVSSNATDDTTRRCSSSISLGKHMLRKEDRSPAEGVLSKQCPSHSKALYPTASKNNGHMQGATYKTPLCQLSVSSTRPPSLKRYPAGSDCLMSNCDSVCRSWNEDDNKGVYFVCPTDQRRFTYGAGGLQTSMPDLRRETVVFKQHVPLKV